MRRMELGIAVAAMAFLMAGPVSAGIVGLRPGGVGGLGPMAPRSLSPGRDAAAPVRPAKPRPRPPGHRPPEHRPGRHHPNILLFPAFIDRDPIEREPEAIPAPAVGLPPEPAAAPAPPPDPRGPIRRLPARGAATPAPALPAPGAAIAPDVPLVILDWRVHALPEPPPGDIWVRLRGEVLRIDATSRVVRANDVAPASAAAPAPD